MTITPERLQEIKREVSMTSQLDTRRELLAEVDLLTRELAERDRLSTGPQADIRVFSMLQGTHIEELESENARLRNALISAREYLLGKPSSNTLKSTIHEIEAALREEK